MQRLDHGGSFPSLVTGVVGVLFQPKMITYRFFGGLYTD